jgi:hypothetical protein
MVVLQAQKPGLITIDGHIAIPIFLRSKHYYLPETLIENLNVSNPFCVPVDDRLADEGLGLSRGDMLICDADWPRWLAQSTRSAHTYVLSRRGRVMVARIPGEPEDVLADDVQVAGVVVGQTSFR